jgi:hypothetical protein
MGRIRSVTMVVLAGLLLTVTLALPAGAARPVRETIPLDNSFLDTESCDPYGFDPEIDLQVSFVGQARIVRFFDRQGNLTRVHVHGSDVATVTNPANGKTAQGVDRWLEIDNRRTGEYTIVGLYYHLNFPGAGIVLLEAGRITFDAEGNVVHLSGPHDVFEGNFGALCHALA